MSGQISGQLQLSEGLEMAMREAREREAARLDAISDIRDAQTLRLYALKQDLMQCLDSSLPKSGFADLALLSGNPPRLWVDLISSVVMAPDPRCYRFEIDTKNGREVILESRDRAEMSRCIVAHLAHRAIDREKDQLSLAREAASGRAAYSGAAVMLAWLAGFALGIFMLFAILTMLSGN
jgi:hypothetical protein